MNIKPILSGAIAVAAAVTTAVITAPTANAMTLNTSTFVSWERTNCIDIRVPHDYDSRNLVVKRACDYDPYQGVHQVSWYKTELINDIVGGDPIMGKATALSCAVYVENKPAVISFARVGDGKDANCLHRLV